MSAEQGCWGVWLRPRRGARARDEGARGEDTAHQGPGCPREPERGQGEVPGAGRDSRVQVACALLPRQEEPLKQVPQELGVQVQATSYSLRSGWNRSCPGPCPHCVEASARSTSLWRPSALAAHRRTHPPARSLRELPLQRGPCWEGKGCPAPSGRCSRTAALQCPWGCPPAAGVLPSVPHLVLTTTVPTPWGL